MTEATDVALSERYLAQIDRLRRVGGEAMVREWDRLGSHDEADLEAFIAAATPILSALQTTSAAFTAGYVAALVGERPPALTLDIDQDLRHPFIGAWKAYADGGSYEDAMTAGRDRSSSLASERVMLTQAEASKGVPGPVGWRRVPRGSTCSYCIVTSTQRYKTAESAARVGHRNKGRRTCDCSIVPIIGDRDPGRIINKPTLKAWKAAQGENAPAYFDADDLGPAARPGT